MSPLVSSTSALQTSSTTTSGTAPQFLCLERYRVRKADAQRSRNAAGAIHHVDFRHRVLVVTGYFRRFEPRNGWCFESANSQRAIVRVRAQAAFPAEASAESLQTGELRFTSPGCIR